MFEPFSKESSFFTSLAQPSSPISNDFSSLQDHDKSSQYRWDFVASPTEWQFPIFLKDQGQPKGQHQYFQYSKTTYIAISNSQVPTETHNQSEVWPDWKLHQEARANPEVTKVIRKKPKPEKKSSANKEQPEQDPRQNKRRNIPGLLFEAMIKECRKDVSFLEENEANLNGLVKHKFLSQLKSYPMNQKTFNSIARYAVKALDQGLVSLILMIKFLRCEWRYSQWIAQSKKMEKEQKELLEKEEERGLLLRKFEVVKEEVEKCLEHVKKWEIEDPVKVWDQSYAGFLTQKIKNQNNFF